MFFRTSDFDPMTKHVPEGAKGLAKVEHFKVTQQESDFTRMRSAFGRRDEYVPAGDYVRLYVGHTLMMTDTEMERSSNTNVVNAAKGDVLIAGLGVGMILVPILRKADVKTVTVVEKFQDVVDLVDPAVRKAVSEAEAKKLSVVTADVFTWEPPKGQKWDCIYFDIWPNICVDNLEEMARLHRRFARRKRTKESWMESWKRGYLQAMKGRERGF